MTPPQHVLLSRTDSIGDVVLTLPMARALKSAYPGVRVSFLGKAYTRPVIEACIDIDQFVDEADFLAGRMAPAPDVLVHVFPKPELARCARALGIRQRIGTTNRLYHWWTCNRLVRLSRKNSDLHEAQLNLKLLAPLGITGTPPLDALADFVRLQPNAPLPDAVGALLADDRRAVVLHPSSRGSAREWRLDDFAALARLLTAAGCHVFISGVESDRDVLQPLLDATAGIATDLVGRLSLAELMVFLQRCDGLVAASTGPLHLAAVLGIATVGLYPPERPMHPGRWAPLGRFATCLVAQPAADLLAAKFLAGIPPEQVLTTLLHLMDRRKGS